MNLVKFNLNDILVMKKKHPCGSDKFKVLRSGSDVRIICIGCSRDLTVSREKIEKSIKSVIPSNDGER